MEVAQTEDNGVVITRNGQFVTQTVDGWMSLLQMTNITIGTPPQPVVVRVDTGSARVWVTDVSCSTEGEPCRPGMSTYDSSKSSTFQDEGKPFEWNSKGVYGRETVALGDGDNQLAVKDVEFGRVTSIDPGAFNGVAGTLGLSQDSPFLKNARAQGVLSEPVFTVWLKEIPPSQDNIPTGLITFGGADSEHCASDITYVPLDTECFWYCMKLKKVTIGSFSSDGNGEWYGK
ncbi:ASP-5 protein [Aphelenchoides avenae]|nr:ASP-5 protein [Aphelenchus avenae]